MALTGDANCLISPDGTSVLLIFKSLSEVEKYIQEVYVTVSSVEPIVYVITRLLVIFEMAPLVECKLIRNCTLKECNYFTEIAITLTLMRDILINFLHFDFYK